MGFKQWLIGGPENYKALVLKNKEIVETEATVQAVVVAKPILTPPSQPPSSPPSPPVIRETLVRPFQVRSIDHQITLEGTVYNINVAAFTWLCLGRATHAKVTISKLGYWSVQAQLMLTHSGSANDQTDEMIGAFAQAGLCVSRRLIDTCLFPIKNQILEIERKLKSFN